MGRAFRRRSPGEPLASSGRYDRIDARRQGGERSGRVRLVGAYGLGAGVPFVSNTTFQSSVARLAGAPGLKKAESWMCDDVT